MRHFLIYDCFLYNLSANKAFIEYQKFKEIIEVGDYSLLNIQKFYRKIRSRIKERMHKEWKQVKLASEPCNGGIPRVEIDESKIIGNSEKVFYMFGIIDRYDNNCRVFCVLDNRSRETLLPIIEQNVETCMDIKNEVYNSNEDLHNHCLSTRVYSDCWAAYQFIDFKEKGYYLHRVNHSYWFGRGNFHTNTIEGLWSQIKRISHDFSGINMTLLNSFEQSGVDIKEYLNDWICSALYFRNCERNNFNKFDKIKYLNKYLQI